MENRFTHDQSVYTQPLDDPQAAVLSTVELVPDANGVVDVTERLQRLLDGVNAGPSGDCTDPPGEICHQPHGVSAAGGAHDWVR